MNGSVNFVSVPSGWTQIPDTDPNCQATGPAQATVDVVDPTGPSLTGGVAGNPFAGSTFCSALHSSDGASLLWHEGIEQTLTGFTIGQSYEISFYQTVVKQQNSIDESGSWSVYVDGTLIGTSAVSTSTLAFDDINLQWDCRTVSFTASATTHTIQFLAQDDDANLLNDPGDPTGALRMGIDQVSFGPCSTVACDLNLTAINITDESCAGVGDGQINPIFSGSHSYDITLDATTYFTGVGAGSHFINPLAAGTYTLTITSTSDPSCFLDTVITVGSGSTAADATINSTGPFCENDASTTLTAADPGGTWSGTGITNATTGEFDPGTAGIGTHTITYGISGSCGDTATTNITVTASDDASFSYPSASYCDSDPNPTAMITGTTGGTFSIDSGGSIDNISGEIDLVATGAGSYTITYTTSGSCPDSSSLNITITSCTPPTANFNISDDFICEGDCITFSDLSTGSPTSWLWAFPGGTPSSSILPDPGLVCFDTAGTHQIQLIVSNGFGSDTIAMPVTVSPTPVVSAGPDENIVIGESVVLTATGSGSTYVWTDAGTLSCDTCQSTTASPQFTTGYMVTLINSAGCIATDSVTVNVVYIEEVGVPNAFTPNGDGVNDVLYVDGAGFSQIDFKIYNRYGQLVFQTVDPSIGWDGTDLTGKKLNPGTFAYVLDYSYIGTSGGIKSGDISLIK